MSLTRVHCDCVSSERVASLEGVQKTSSQLPEFVCFVSEADHNEVLEKLVELFEENADELPIDWP